MPSLDTALGGFASFGDLVSFGQASPLVPRAVYELAQLVGADLLDGYDRRAPMHLVVLLGPGDPPVEARVLILRVSDEARLRQAARGAALRIHRGWAAIGSPAAVTAVGPWALNELVSGPPPPLPTLQLRPPVLIDAGLDAQATAALAGATADGASAAMNAALLRALATALWQCDRVELTIDASGRGLALSLSLTPRDGTALASFTAAQRPSTFALMPRLPAPAATVYLGGRIAPGPYAADARALAEPWLGFLHHESEDLPSGVFVDNLLASATGEVALVQAELDPTSSSVAVAATVEPTTAARALWGIAARLRASPRRDLQPGLAAEISVTDESFSGVAITRTSVQLGHRTNESYVGLDGATLLFAYGPGARHHVAHLADPGRHHTPMPLALSSLVEAARTRGDSLLFTLDAAAYLPAATRDVGLADPRPPAPGDGIWLTLGATGRVLRIHAGLPAEQVRAFRLLSSLPEPEGW